MTAFQKVVFYLVLLMALVMALYCPEKVIWKILFSIFIICVGWLAWEVDHALPVSGSYDEKLPIQEEE